MPEDFAPLVGRVVPWLLTYLLHSTVLISVVWALDRSGMVRRARTLDLLWKAALLAGFLTSSLVVGHAVVRRGGAVAEVEARLHRADAPAPAEALTWVAPEGTTRFEARVVEPSPECRSLIEQRAGGEESWIRDLKAACVPRRLDARALLVLVWIGGAGALLLLAWRDRRRLAAALAECTAARGRIAAIGASIARAGAAPSEIVVSGVVPAPCAVGRRVVLPVRCEKEMDDGELAAVLAHELAHLERRDPWWLAAADLVCRVAWIQPLNRLATVGLRDAAELMTDQLTLRHTRPLDLARSIHRVSHWAVPGPRPARVLGLARARDGSLTRRVRRILAPVREREVGPAWPGALLALALGAAATFLPPVAATRELHAIMIERVEGSPPGAMDVTATLPDAPPGGTRVVVRVRAAAPTAAGATAR